MCERCLWLTGVCVCVPRAADMLTLRGMAVGAGVLGFAFNMLQKVPLKIPLYWGLVFLAINSTQTLRLYASRHAEAGAAAAAVEDGTSLEVDAARELMFFDGFL